MFLKSDTADIIFGPKSGPGPAGLATTALRPNVWCCCRNFWKAYRRLMHLNLSMYDFDCKENEGNGMMGRSLFGVRCVGSNFMQFGWMGGFFFFVVVFSLADDNDRYFENWNISKPVRNKISPLVISTHDSSNTDLHKVDCAHIAWTSETQGRLLTGNF